MEELESTYHSADMEVVEPTETMDTETPDTIQEEVVPQGITVKYNKEERFIPNEEVNDWVQKGLNYEKVSERASTYEKQAQNLDRVAKFYGYTNHDEFMAAIDEAERDRHVQQEADRLGVDESVIREHLSPMRDQLQQYESKLKQIEEQETQRQIESEISSLKAKYPDFEQVQTQVFDMVISGEVKTLEKAYLLATYEQKVAQAAKQAQQETIKNINKNAATSTGALGAEGSEEKHGYSSLSAAEKRDLRERVKRGDVKI